MSRSHHCSDSLRPYPGPAATSWRHWNITTETGRKTVPNAPTATTRESTGESTPKHFYLPFPPFSRNTFHVIPNKDTFTPTNALLSFSVRNVRSYWEEATLSLLGTRVSEPGVLREISIAGSTDPITVLPVAGIFGANASGKSTALRAMADMRELVLRSFRRGHQDTKLRRRPFCLNNQGTVSPSRFAIDLILNNVRWQYGFEIDDDQVIAEYAYHYPRGRQALVFRREQGNPAPTFGPLFRTSGRLLSRFVRKNALLLSVAGAAADETVGDRSEILGTIGPLFAWFRTNLLLMDSANRDARISRTAELLESPDVRDGILGLLQAADLGIAGIERVQIDPEFAERLQKAIRILRHIDEDSQPGDDDQIQPDIVRLSHMGEDGPTPIDPEHESQGTRVWIGMLGPVLDILGEGAVVQVDELDASLHPHLVNQFIKLFQNPKTNPLGAQLVFNAHDTTILGNGGRRTLGRDQIWLTEKGVDGTTTLYSMAEFQPKRGEALGKRYLQGRYGGIPVLDAAEFEHATDISGS